MRERAVVFEREREEEANPLASEFASSWTLQQMKEVFCLFFILFLF